MTVALRRLGRGRQVDALVGKSSGKAVATYKGPDTMKAKMCRPCSTPPTPSLSYQLLPHQVPPEP